MNGIERMKSAQGSSRRRSYKGAERGKLEELVGDQSESMGRAKASSWRDEGQEISTDGC